MFTNASTWRRACLVPADHSVSSVSVSLYQRQKGTLILTNAKHHGGAEYPLGHVDLPVEPPAVEDPRAPHPRRAVGPVGVEVCYPLLGPVQPHLHHTNNIIIKNILKIFYI